MNKLLLVALAASVGCAGCTLQDCDAAGCTHPLYLRIVDSSGEPVTIVGGEVERGAVVQDYSYCEAEGCVADPLYVTGAATEAGPLLVRLQADGGSAIEATVEPRDYVDPNHNGEGCSDCPSSEATITVR